MDATTNTTTPTTWTVHLFGEPEDYLRCEITDLSVTIAEDACPTAIGSDGCEYRDHGAADWPSDEEIAAEASRLMRAPVTVSSAAHGDSPLEKIYQVEFPRGRNVTAQIFGRGSRSTVPDNAGAVDATIYVDGREVGACTLLVRQDGDWLDVWGSIDHWADDTLRKSLDAGTLSAEDVVEAARGFGGRRPRRMQGTISNWSRRRRTKASPCRFAVSGSDGTRVSLRMLRQCERDPDGPDEESDLEMSRADACALRDALDRILATTGGAP